MKYVILLWPILANILAMGQCPSISKQPFSQIDCEGNSIRMIIETDANTIQWEKKRPTDATYSIISGAKNQNYQVYPSGGAIAPDGTLYRAKLTTGTCSIYSEEASISLNTITNITGTSICERSTGQLQVNMPQKSQNRVRKYQWTSAIDGGNYQDLVDNEYFEGVNSSLLTIKNVSLKNQSQKFKIRIDFEVSPNNDNDGSTNNSNQSQTCPRTSSEVSLTIKTTPIPNHSVKSYSTCLYTKSTLSSSGCSPYSTIWYNANSEKVGEGARASILFEQKGLQLFKASCLKNGCESEFSQGVNVHVEEIPERVYNTGTPEKIKEGGSITFKASGETNNIWYLNEKDEKNTSTASTLSLKNVAIDGPNPYYISRWVSQKINGCESGKTEIKVLVEPENQIIPSIEPGTDPSPTPTPNPAPNPEPTPNPEPMPNPGPEPEPIPEPVIQQFDLLVKKNCQRESYLLNSNNCPNSVDYFDAVTSQFIGTSTYEKDFELDARWTRKIIAKCNVPFFAENYSEFIDLKNPEIKISQTDKLFFCPKDSLTLESQHTFPAKFLYWEKDGHVFSTTNKLVIIADSSRFEAIYTNNDCIYRTFPSPIIIRPKPTKPQLIYSKNIFCPNEKIEVTSKEPAFHYFWSDGQKKEFNQITDNKTISLVVQNEFNCNSDSSEAVKFVKLPKGEKPVLTTPKLQFCEGDTSIIYSNIGEETFWSNGMKKAHLEITETSTLFAYSISQNGCYSDSSEIIKVIKRPKPKQPVIEQPFNRILRGIKNSDNNPLEWKINEKIINLPDNELRIENPVEVSVLSQKTYEQEGMNPLTCKSNEFKLVVNEVNPYHEMEVYPNPTFNFQIYITTPEEIKEGKLQLFDINGHMKWEENIQNRQNPLIKNIPKVNPGIYFLRIQSSLYAEQKRIIIME
ncbi:MAG: hypothetical protein RJA76_453 [Bacteroidota bacterium]|jgi:hypothetical protein